MIHSLLVPVFSSSSISEASIASVIEYHCSSCFLPSSPFSSSAKIFFMLFCAQMLNSFHCFISGSSRNVLVESARIARGKIASLAKLTTADHDAVIFPGGFGAAKNLWVPTKH